MSLDANGESVPARSSLVCMSCCPHRQCRVESPRQRCCLNTITDEAAATALIYFEILCFSFFTCFLCGCLFIVARLRRLFTFRSSWRGCDACLTAGVCTHVSRHNRVRSLCSAIRTHSTDSPLASIYSRSFIGDGIEAATLAGTLNRTLPVRAA